jgi:hypothetical protein
MTRDSHNTVESMSEESLLGDRLKPNQIVGREPGPPSQLAMDISITGILTYFAVDFAVTGWLLVGILLDQAGPEFFADIYRS